MFLLLRESGAQYYEMYPTLSLLTLRFRVLRKFLAHQRDKPKDTAIALYFFKHVVVVVRLVIVY